MRFDQKLKNKLFIFFLILFALHLLFRIVSYQGEYVSRYDATYWKERYLRSQWVMSPPKETIGDDGLYAYVGWEYMQGHDPTLLNAELPPLGKYLIGLSILVFGNQNIFALLSGLFVLAAFYFMNTALTRDRFFAFVPVALFSLEPLFYTQLRAPFLDLLYLGFLLLCFGFVFRKKYLSAVIALGLMASVKASASTFVIVPFAVVVYLLFTRQYKDLKKFSLYLPVSVFVFMLTYLRYFLLGHDLREFLGVQKYILAFYSDGAKGDWITPWQILLTGQWHTWWGETLRVAEWHIGWTIGTLIAFLYLPFAIYHLPFINTWIKSKRENSMVHGIWKIENKLFANRVGGSLDLIAIWFIVYMLFLSIVPVWPRYLLLALPFLYNLTIWVLPKSMLRH